MTSEIRANTLKNRVGLGTVEYTNTGIVVSGIVTANSFSGPLTATSIDLNGDLDVDGHTNLDNVSIAGVTTMTGNLSVGETLTVSGNNPNITFTDTNSNPDFKIYGSNGTFTILDSTNGVNRFAINSTGHISVSNDLDVDGHTYLDNVSIAGVTTFAQAAGAVTVPAGGDIRIANSGGWTGEYGGKIQQYLNFLYIQGGSNGIRFRYTDGNDRWVIGSGGHFDPGAGGAYDIGNTGNRVRQIYSTNVNVSGVSTFTGEIVAGSLISVNTGGSINIPDKLIHSGDPDTAIRFPSNDNISFEVGGVERLRIDNVTGNQVIARDATASIMRVENSTAAASQVAMLDLAPAGSLSGVQIKATSEEDYSTGANRTAFFTIDVRKDGTFYERLRINSNGDVTTTGQASFDRQNAGFTARAGDSVSITRASGTPLEINRTGSDGQMIGLLDDNSYEAAIGLSGGSLVFGLPNVSTPRLTISSTGHVEMAGDLKTGNLPNRNIVINGDMRVAQRATSASMSSSGNHIPVCDRWQYNRNGPSATIARVAEAPAGRGFKYSLKWTNTSPVGSIAVGNVVKFSYAIETQDIQRLGYGSANGKKATLSFWAKGSLSGKIGVSCTRDSRIFSANEDIVANTWKFIEITIPVDTSTGFSGDDTATGFYFGIVWGAGSNSTSGAVNSWINFHNAYSAGFTAGQQGAYLQTNGSTFQITGVQLEIGSQSTPFEHRTISEELLRCQRYFKRMRGAVGGGGGYGSAGDGAVATLANWTNTGAYGLLPLGVEMRYAPKLTGFANLNYFSAGNTWAPGSSSQCYLAGSSYDRVEITLQGMSNMSQGNAGWLRIDNVNGYMDFDAEL